LLPSYVGEVLEEELKALKKSLEFKKKPRLLILGGAKVKEALETLNFLLREEKIEKVLLSGIAGELFLKAQGYDFSAKEEFFKKRGLLELIPLVKEISQNFFPKLVLPIDLAFEVKGKRKELSIKELPVPQTTTDIGSKTIELFLKEIKKSKMVLMSGPAGIFESLPSSIGSKKLLQGIASSKAFSLILGGDTSEAVDLLKLNEKNFSYISPSGHAALEFLSGKHLVAFKTLKKFDLKLRESVELKKKDLIPFLNALNKKLEVIVPVENEEKIKRFERFDGLNLLLDSLPLYSIKRFLIPSKAELFEFNEKNGSYKIKPKYELTKRVFFGIRSCDLHAVERLDRILLQKPVDSFYESIRKNSFLLGLSCLTAGDNCFCTSLGTHLPINFDLFFWEKEDSFFVEIGSKKGKALVQKFKSFFSKPSCKKPHIIPNCPNEIKVSNIQKTLENNREHSFWDKMAEICLSCGSCTMVCPTCYCYRIKDEFFLPSNNAVRLREWDSCQLLRFSTVAGEKVFRESRKSRLQQFVYHKFLYFPKNFDLDLCVGCGRCITECTVGISISKIINVIGGKENE
jgi:sulfhydrogenase subunit beta (sulfur reductase)